MVLGTLRYDGIEHAIRLMTRVPSMGERSFQNAGNTSLGQLRFLWQPSPEHPARYAMLSTEISPSDCCHGDGFHFGCLGAGRFS